MRKKVLIFMFAIGLVATLSGCRGNTSTSMGQFEFDKEQVKEVVTTYEEIEEYQLEVQFTSMELLDVLGDYFYRDFVDGTYVYYSMQDIQITSQENTSSTGYGDFVISNYFEGVIAIDSGTFYNLYLVDGTYLGDYEYSYGAFYAYDDYYNINDVDYNVYYVEWNYDLIYYIIHDMSTDTYYALDRESNMNFYAREYIEENLSSVQSSEDGLITKMYAPFFEEDSGYYYINSGYQIIIYDEENTLINSFDNEIFSYNSVLVGTTILSQSMIMVSEDQEEYTFSADGRKYDLTTTSYDVLSGEYKELELNYLFFGMTHNEEVSSHVAVRINEIGPGKALMENTRNVIIDSSGEVVSDLLNFSDMTVYYDGYFYDDDSNSLFTEDLTIISNNVVEYSFEYKVLLINENGSQSIYNIEGELLVSGDDYDVVGFTQGAALLESDTGLYLYSFETKTIEDAPFDGEIVFENEFVLITFEEATGVLNLLDSRDLEVLESHTFSGMLVDIYNIEEMTNQMNVDEDFKVTLFVYTNAGQLRINYDVEYQE